MNKFLFVLIFFSCSLHAFSQDVSTARWMKQPATIDGTNNEWGSLNFYDDYTRLNFAIANDSDNIYLCFESTDEVNQMKLMRGGMKITLSAKGKSKHEASITYPLMQTTEQKENAADSLHATHNRESFRQNFLTQHSTMQLAGFATTNGVVPINNNTVKLALNWDSSSNLICEVAISKTEFFGKDYSAKDANADITLNVEINGLPKSALSDAGKNSGRYHMDNSMPAGDMNRSNMHHNGFNNADKKFNQAVQDNANNQNTISLSDKTSFKQKFVLSNNNQ